MQITGVSYRWKTAADGYCNKLSVCWVVDNEWWMPTTLSVEGLTIRSFAPGRRDIRFEHVCEWKVSEVGSVWHHIEAILQNIIVARNAEELVVMLHDVTKRIEDVLVSQQ